MFAMSPKYTPSNIEDWQYATWRLHEAAREALEAKSLSITKWAKISGVSCANLRNWVTSEFEPQPKRTLFMFHALSWGVSIRLVDLFDAHVLTATVSERPGLMVRAKQVQAKMTAYLGEIGPYSFGQLAWRINHHPTHLARGMKGSTNFSFKTLWELCQEYSVNFEGLVERCEDECSET